MKQTVLLTGVTGAFGSYLLHELLQQAVNVILIVRASNTNAAQKRIAHFIPQHHRHRVMIFNGDLTLPNAGLTVPALLYIRKYTTHILHAAAATRFTYPLKDARLYNVATTKTMIALAQECLNLQLFGHMSTCYVAGKRTGIVYERELTHTKGFVNTYEHSKYEAEQYVASQKDIPTAIFRPSIIVTPPTNFVHQTALSFAIRIIRSGMLPVLPGTPPDHLDIVPATWAASCISNLLFMEKAVGSTYHIAGGSHAPTLAEIANRIMNGKKIPLEFAGSHSSYRKRVRQIVRWRPDMAFIYKKTDLFLPTLSYPKQFDTTTLRKHLGTNIGSFNPLEVLQSLL